MMMASYSGAAVARDSTMLAAPATPAASTPVAIASTRRRTCRLTSRNTAKATGRMSSANRATLGAMVSRACGSRAVAPTMSVSTPAVVALAATPAMARTTISVQDTMQRSRSTGLRIRRSS